MATIQHEQRLAALDALLARGGQGRVASNDEAWQGTIAPALTGAPSDRANRTRQMWDARNASVSQANRAMVGGYGSALNSSRQQGDEEWLRKYNEQLAKSRGGGGGRSGGGGGGDDEPTWTPQAPVDPWAWLDEYLTMPTLPPPPPVARTTPGQTRRPRLPAPGQGGGARYM